jgi:isocitrate dehydrogenase (NAD+)
MLSEMLELRECILISGDGVGPEVSGAAVKTLEAAGARVKFTTVELGEKAYQKYGDVVPNEVLSEIKRVKTALKGPVAVPIGSGLPSANRKLRRSLDVFASVRVAKPFGRPCRVPEEGLVVIMDNVEGSNMNLQHFLDQDGMVAEAILPNTMKNVRRLTQYAFDYCAKNKRKKITIVTLADHFKFTDGMWLRAANEIKKNYPSLEYSESLADSATFGLVQNPADFDVILANDIWGETISSLVGGLVGSNGMTPAINLGGDIALFETVHGAGLDIAGKNIANPTAMIYDAALLLRHFGDNRRADAIEKALMSVIKDGKTLTSDLGGSASTTQFTDEVISRLEA